ncbi:MAG: molybdopterin-dependent oxidoreductase, partial [Burkholderiales bacterium]|nr:molybdopterin-dependent oxidoreductase [Burkholderiales bacterium]
MSAATGNAVRVPTYCYQCVAGPDLLTVKVVDGVATELEPNLCSAGIHPGGGKVCVKAYGLVQKTYHPNRVLTPMKRTNPRKGRGEDPMFVPISWDEAYTAIADKLNAIRAEGLHDASGYPRVAATFGGGGTPQSYMGTFPAFLSAWGAVDMGFGSGQGVKCYHSEHLYGEFWHRAFIVAPDTPRTEYLISCGANVEASGGVVGIWRHANARVRGMKRVQVEPHLSITGACSAEWVPIKPKTDAAFLFALMQVMLHEARRERLDLRYLTKLTASPYLVGPNGYYLRDPASSKPLVWDRRSDAAVAHDAPGIDEALEGTFEADAIEIGPDGEVLARGRLAGTTAFSKLVEHVATYTPEWAERVCEVPAKRIRRIANEYLDHAHVGETIVVDGVTLPFRPVAVSLGKTVNNGWGGYECCWARTMLAALVGALEVPGGTIGTTVRLNRPQNDRLKSVKAGPDGFMAYPLNPTGKDTWSPKPNIRNAYKTMVPLAADGPWSQALGPTHFSWMFMDETPKGLPRVAPPDVWFVYRSNPAISFWDTPGVQDKMARFPFIVAFAFTRDETNHFADILLPDAVDLESLQLIRVGGTKFVEQFWNHQGFALRQPAVAAQGEARDFTDIASELAERCGLTQGYIAAINRGVAGGPLTGGPRSYELDPARRHTRDEIWDAVCRAASSELSDGQDSHGLDWWRERGFHTKPFPQVEWYLLPTLEEHGLRFELPYQERLKRVGVELGNRLHEHDMHWWDRQLEEYRALPAWKDFPGLWDEALVDAGAKPADYPMWMLTARRMQYAWGGNVGMQ